MSFRKIAPLAKAPRPVKPAPAKPAKPAPRKPECRVHPVAPARHRG
ncbi:hypothetical protein [Peterkaempfera sp. SMS 1(5)a]